MKKLYVAYGSNLNVEQMARRCPYATIYGVGKLNNWELLYRGRRGNAHATIKRKKGSSIPVLVWSITEFDEKRLDSYEGYPVYYIKKNVMVDFGGCKKKCIVYIMSPDKCKIADPSKLYTDIILQGYKDCGFDLDYYYECLEKNALECLTDLGRYC